MSLAGGVILLGLFQECTSNRQASLHTLDHHKEERRREARKESKDEADKEEPSWVKMMNEPNVNYFEAINAFNQYWQGRQVPEERGRKDESEKENEREKEGKREREREREREKEKEGYEEDEEEMEAETHPLRIAYKKFNAWQREVYPYVQADGSIMTPEQQMEVYKNQRK